MDFRDYSKVAEAQVKRLIAGLLAALVLITLISCTKSPAANISAGGSTPLPVTNQTQPPAAPKVTPGVGDPAPELVLADMTGKTVSLADYKGRVVWLNFWATW